MNLVESIPRSPKIVMGGLVMVPRMIDKAKAFNSKTLGEYIFPCPLDKIILEFLNTDHKEFSYQTQKLSEKEISFWVEEKCLKRSKNEKDFVNKKLLNQKPDSLESLNRFNEILKKINPIAKNVTTWIELIELEERQTFPKNT